MRKVAARTARRHMLTATYGSSAMADEFDYDLFTIGAGSGGVRASRVAAAHGARVAVAEEYRVGGTCVIRGCVPKKMLVYGAHFAEDLEDAKSFGWTIRPALTAHSFGMKARGSRQTLFEGQMRLRGSAGQVSGFILSWTRRRCGASAIRAGAFSGRDGLMPAGRKAGMGRTRFAS